MTNEQIPMTNGGHRHQRVILWSLVIGHWDLIGHWGLVIGVFLFSFPVLAADPASLPPKLDSSVIRALDFLEKQQNADGAFETGGPRVATTGLGVMAFLAAGHEPDV